MKKTNYLAGVKEFFVKNQAKILFLLLWYEGMSLFNQIPYINLIIPPDTQILFFLFVFLSVFRLPYAHLITIAYLFLIIAGFFSIIKNVSLAERLGEWSFYLFVLGWVVKFKKFLTKTA